MYVGCEVGGGEKVVCGLWDGFDYFVGDGGVDLGVDDVLLLGVVFDDYCVELVGVVG